MILKKYIKSILLEMSRPRKKAFAQYGHPGLKRDALFIHWVFADSVPHIHLTTDQNLHH
jgi:hypothetical protein